jgi:hypothetical protein
MSVAGFVQSTGKDSESPTYDKYPGNDGGLADKSDSVHLLFGWILEGKGE